MKGLRAELPRDLGIVDLHVHVGTYDGGSSFPAAYLEHLCDAFPIERFVWAAFSWDESVHQAEDSADPLRDSAVRSRASRWLWICPTREAALELLAQPDPPTGYAGIKLHPAADAYDLVPLLTDPVVAAAERWRVPIAVHTGSRGCRARSVASAFGRGLTCPLVLFHSRPVDEAIAVAREIPSASLELSFASPADLDRAIDELGADRVVFGSDYPAAALYYRGLDVIDVYRRELLGALEVTERRSATREFFRSNALRLLGPAGGSSP